MIGQIVSAIGGLATSYIDGKTAIQKANAEIKLKQGDADKKRLVYKLEMTHKNKSYRAATTGVCSLYVDLDKRKVTEIEAFKKDKINEFIEKNKMYFQDQDLKLLSKLKK